MSDVLTQLAGRTIATVHSDWRDHDTLDDGVTHADSIAITFTDGSVLTLLEEGQAGRIEASVIPRGDHKEQGTMIEPKLIEDKRYVAIYHYVQSDEWPVCNNFRLIDLPDEEPEARKHQFRPENQNEH